MPISAKRFIDAARQGNRRIVTNYIQENRDNPDAVNVSIKGAPYFGSTALLHAVAHGHADIVNILLSAPGVNVNARTRGWDTVLHLAAHNGHSDVVTALLTKAEININARTRRGNTALFLAVDSWEIDSVDALLANPGTDVNVRNRKGETALMWAVEENKDDKVAKLLRVEGIDVNAVDHNNETALIKAACRGNAKIVAALLARPEIDIHHQDDRGNTASSIAQDYLRGNFEGIVDLFSRREQKHQEEKHQNRPKPPSFQERLEAIHYQEDIPEEFKDIFSYGIMNDPITVSSGKTYDRESLKDYFGHNNTCPLTRKTIHRRELANGTNTTIRNMEENFVEQKEAEHVKQIAAQSQEAPSRKRMCAARMKLFGNSQHDSKSVPEADEPAGKRIKR